MLAEQAASGVPLSCPIPPFHIGDGVVDQLPAELERRAIDTPLIVTDEGIDDAGLLGLVADLLPGDPPVHYATREPTDEAFADLPSGAFDGVVALGGGSCLDSAKVVSLLSTHGGAPTDYLGEDLVPGPVKPIIAIPTTSGTGSQATQTAVITHDGVKRGISDEHLRPTVALVDPTLTYGLPARQTALSGFDAFVHALESLTARDHQWVPARPITYQGASPVSRPLSLQALHLVHRSLERATYDGADRGARRDMSLGSHLAGTAFSIAGLGAVHALASTVGGLTDRPHGACLAASVRAGFSYNLPVRRRQYAAVATELGLVDRGESVATAADALIAEFGRLADSLGLPGSLAGIGLDGDDTDEIVENTLLQERRLHTNPREVTADLGDVVAADFE